MFVGLPISPLCVWECLLLCVRIAPTFFSSHPNIGGCECSIPFKHAHAPAHTNMSCTFLILFFVNSLAGYFFCTQLIWGLFKYCKNLICCRKRIKYLNIDYGTCVRSLVHSIVRSSMHFLSTSSKKWWQMKTCGYWQNFLIANSFQIHCFLCLYMDTYLL